MGLLMALAINAYNSNAIPSDGRLSGLEGGSWVPAVGNWGQAATVCAASAGRQAAGAGLWVVGASALPRAQAITVSAGKGEGARGEGHKVPLAGPRLWNRNANRIQSNRLIREEVCPLLKMNTFFHLLMDI